jgi:transposase
MTSVRYIGLDVHKESISICVRNSVGKVVMESVIETKASTILQFIDGLRGDLWVTFEEGTWAAWLHDSLKPHVSGVVVCNPRKNALLKDGSKNDRIDANKLSEQLYMNNIESVYHREHGLRTLKELARSYLIEFALAVRSDLHRGTSRGGAACRSRPSEASLCEDPAFGGSGGSNAKQTHSGASPRKSETTMRKWRR